MAAPYQADLDLIRARKVAILGYGSQGHAHALNLKDSGVDVRAGLAEGSRSRKKATGAGLKVVSVAEASKEADVIMVLIPDQTQRAVDLAEIAPHLGKGKALLFAHGFNIHFGQIVPPEDVDVLLVAPKGPGHMVRRQYQDGRGIPGLIAIHQDATGKARERCLALGVAIGSGYLFETAITSGKVAVAKVTGAGNPQVLCPGSERAWQFQKRVIDYIIKSNSGAIEDVAFVERIAKPHQDGLPAVMLQSGLAGLGAADLDDVPAGRLGAEMVVVGDDAVHLGARQVQRPGNHRRRLARNVAEGVLHVVQDRQQRAGAAGMGGEDRFERPGVRCRCHLVSTRPA